MENLVDGVVATDSDGNQIILQLCEVHSDTTTPKQARLAYEVRSSIDIIITKAASNGLNVEIPTVIVEGATMTAIRQQPLIPLTANQVVPEPVRRMPKLNQSEQSQNEGLEPISTSTVQGIGGSKATIPAVMSDNSRVVVVRRTDEMLQRHQKRVSTTDTSFKDGYDIRDCVLCRGSGVVRKSQTEDMTCPKCDGSGIFSA